MKTRDEEIVSLLKDKPLSFRLIADELKKLHGMKRTAVSYHLAQLVLKGALEQKVQGRQRYYGLVNALRGREVTQLAIDSWRSMCISEPTAPLPEKPIEQMLNPVLSPLIRDGHFPMIVIGGLRQQATIRLLSEKVANVLVKICHEQGVAYRDRGLPNEKQYDLDDARFDVTQQLLHSLQTIPSLLQPAPPLGNGLSFGSPIISDASSVTMNALSFNNPVIKEIVSIHDSALVRLIPWILNVPGSVVRVAYGLREITDFFIQVKSPEKAKVYTTNESETGRTFLKALGVIIL